MISVYQQSFAEQIEKEAAFFCGLSLTNYTLQILSPAAAQDQSQNEADRGRDKDRLAWFLTGEFLCVLDQLFRVFVLQFLELVTGLGKFIAGKILCLCGRILYLLSI